MLSKYCELKSFGWQLCRNCQRWSPTFAFTSQSKKAKEHEMYKSFLIENFLLSFVVFNIITRKTLLEYCKKYPAAATALQQWYHELVRCDFKNFNDLKRMYGNASLVADDRVVFNIMGNKYRLVV